MRKLSSAVLAISGFVAIALAAGSASAQVAGPADWPRYLHDNAGTGFNQNETVFNLTNAGSMKIRKGWPVGGSANKTISAQVVVANSLAYWGSWDGVLHATPTTVNPSGGWNRALGVNTGGAGCSPNPVGLASTPVVVGSTLYVGGGGNDTTGGGQARLYALDALTGTVLWRTDLGHAPENFMWSSPAYYNGSVYVGVASFGDCPLVQGKLYRLDAASGAILNTFAVVPSGCTGGGVWSSPVIDETAGTVFFTTGNPGGCGQSEPLAEALVKVNASDLSLLGSWKVPATEQTPDGDFGAAATLFTGNGQARVGAQNKNGIYYAFNRGDATNGLTKVWQRRVGNGGDCPQCGTGGISPSAFDGVKLYVGSGATSIGGKGYKGGLFALDPANGNIIWSHGLSSGAVLGAVSAAGKLAAVGQGNAIIIVRTDNGQTVFRAYTNLTFYAPPSIANGVLYEGDTAGKVWAVSVNGN